MRKIYKHIIIFIILCLVLSCSKEKPLEKPFVWDGAVPAAFLQTGEVPVWFQLTESGPVHIQTVQEAAFSRAVEPWSRALHICFLQEREGSLIMLVNRDGFLKISPNSAEASGLSLYRFHFGEDFRQYTAGGLVFYDEKPAALLYADNRFINASVPVPIPQTWSFNMESNITFPIEIPALRLFPEEEGWDADILRLSSDGFYYYRVKNERKQEMLMFRTKDLSQRGEEIPVDVFFNSAPKEAEINHPSLPLLPEGFSYTAIGQVGDSIFAAWEEQEDFGIGAAGFMAVKK